MIDMGVARPRAQGHAMINTATALTSAYESDGAGPQIAHAANASTAIEITAGTNMPATESARF